MGAPPPCRPPTIIPTTSATMSVLTTAISLLGLSGIHQGTPDFQDSSFGQNVTNSERPMNVKPTDQGGVAIDGRGDLPEGHANMADKVIGGMQKVNLTFVRTVCFESDPVVCRQATGKYMKKPELYEKGELRESGGKLAVTGEACAPHD